MFNMTRIFIQVLQAGHKHYMVHNKLVILRILNEKIRYRYARNFKNFVQFKTIIQRSFFSTHGTLYTRISEEDTLQNGMEDCKDSSEKLRSFLYPNSKDEIIKKLNACVTIQQVFDIINENKKSLNHEHSSQALTVLWDLKKVCERENFTEDIADEATVFRLSEEVKGFVSQIINHESFKILVDSIKHNYSFMTVDALAISLLHLHKLGIPLKHEVMQNIVMKLEEFLDSVEPKDFPSTALSRFSVVLSHSHELWASILSVKLIPHVTYRIGNCSTHNDFQTLVISVGSVGNLLSNDAVNDFKLLIERLIGNGVLNSKATSIVLKTISVLDNPLFSHINTNVIRKLMLLCAENMDRIPPTFFPTIRKTFFFHLEPYSAMVSIDQYLKQQLERYRSEDVKPPGLLVSAAVYFLPTCHRRSLYHYIEDIIRHPVSIESLFNVQSSITSSDVNLCNTYWEQVGKFLKTNEINLDALLLLCSRYTDFCSSMEFFRNYSFENQVIKLLTDEMTYGTAGIVPTQFARIAAFIIAFDHTKTKYYECIPKHIVSKLMENMEMFTPYDCLKISKGLQLLMEFRRRKALMHTFLQQFVKLDAALSERALKYLHSEKEICIPNLNMIVRAYINRKGLKNTELFHELIRRYDSIDEDELTSRNVRDIIYNILITDLLIPSLLDKIVKYCLRQKEHILGETVGKVLSTCYRLAYTPAQADVFLPLCAELIKRDYERMNGLSLLQFALALNYFSYLPVETVNVIFTVEFLENLEEEIFHCYQKASYPSRLRYSLMQLNRAVCLDKPETGVPWFHAKYCEEQLAIGHSETGVSKRHSFYNDVHSSLTSLVGSEDFIDTSGVSPYGYKIHFLIHMDSKQTPMGIKNDKDSHVSSKVAIILRTSDDYTTNVVQLKGYQQMKIRHLEIMGYRVVEITDSFWNSMFMAEPKAKVNHLHKLIWPKQETMDVISASRLM